MKSRGLLAALGANFFWGLAIPLYLHILSYIAPLEILAVRILVSAIILCGILTGRSQIGTFIKLCRAPAELKWLAFSATLVLSHWALATWAMTTGHVIECSLAYFLNPLLTVAIGVIFFKERLHRRQIFALGLAVTAIAALFVQHGERPWLPLALGGTFSVYAMAKKRLRISPLFSTAFEAIIWALPSLGFLIVQKTAAASTLDVHSFFLVCGFGVVTTIPFFLFSFAAQRLSMSSLGFVSYLQPTLQFIFAYSIGREELTTANLYAFAAIWAALIVYSVSTYTKKPTNVNEPTREAA